MLDSIAVVCVAAASQLADEFQQPTTGQKESRNGDWFFWYRLTGVILEKVVIVHVSRFNPLMGTKNYSATSNSMKLVQWYTGRWWVGCYIWYSEEGTGRGRSPPRPLLAVPNVTAHPSTASVPITVFLYNGPLLCGFNVPIKGLKQIRQKIMCTSEWNKRSIDCTCIVEMTAYAS